MIEHLSRLVQPILKIKKEEWPRSLLMFSYFFLLMSAYYIIKPVRSGIFLERVGPDKLPYVYMMQALLVGIVSFFYARFVDRHKKENILIASTLIFSGCLAVFWVMFNFHVAWFAYIFYLWSAVFSVMAVTQFWLLTNDLFDPRQGKRLFGFIGSGGVLGAIAGGAITERMVHTVGTENLLLVAAGIILLCVIITKLVYGISNVDKEGNIHKKGEKAEPSKEHASLLKLVVFSRYLLLILFIVGIGKVISTFVDFQFQSAVDAACSTKDAKTAFFGGFYAYLNLAAFLVQFLLTAKLFKKFGIGVTLLALPVGLVFGMSAFLVLPIFFLSVSLKFYDGSLNYSLQSASREILYLPIDSTVRHKVKPFIDMFIYRFSQGIGGVLILILISAFHRSSAALSLAALVMLGLWMLAVCMIKREYIETLRRLIAPFVRSKTPVKEEAVRIQPKFLEALGSTDIKKVFCEPSGICDREHRKMLLAAEIALFGRAENGDNLLAEEFLKTLYLDAAEREKVKSGIAVSRDGSVMDIDQMIRQMAPYASLVSRINYLKDRYKKVLTGMDVPLKEFIDILYQENLEAIFHLMSMRYSPELLQLIYNRHLEGDTYLKAHAAELLGNIVDRKIERLVLPIIEQEYSHVLTQRGKWAAESEDSVIQGCFSDKSAWLVMAVMFLVERCGLKGYYPAIRTKISDEDLTVRGAARLVISRIEEEAVNGN